MKLPKFSLPKKSSKEIDTTGFLVLDLTDHSAKGIHYTKTGDKNFIADGVSIRESKDEIVKTDIESVIKDCQAQSGKKSKEIIVGLSGQDTIGFVLIAKKKRENVSDLITAHELEELYDKLRNSAYTQAQKKWALVNPDEAALVPLDMVITNTMVDKEIVEDAEGKIGEALQVNVFCSYANANYHKKITKLVKSLGLDPLAVTSTLYSQSKLINESTKNYIVVDIGRKYTEIAVVLGGDIIQTRTFEMGGDFFTASLSTTMGYDYNTANGKKEAYGLKTLPDKEMDEIGDHLYEAGTYWRTGLAAILESMTGIKSFPHRIYLTGGGAHLEILEELLYDETWYKAVPFAQKVEIEKTNQEMWRHYIHDQLNVISGPQMFVPASLGIVLFEVYNNE